MSVALTVTGLAKAYGATPVLTGVDLTAPEGGVTALIGRSGSGKTTLLRLVAGFDRPDAGTVALGDRVLTSATVAMAPERRRLGYVTQDGSLFPHLTVAGNVAFGLRGQGRQARRVVVEELLDLVALNGAYARRYPHQLSGGEQQRVALARALAPRPDLLLLDEPFSALDAELRAETRTAVMAALAATATTTVLVTHDQAEAMAVAGTVALLRDGVVAQSGSPRQLYWHPADPGVAAFTGELTTIPGRCAGTSASTPLGEIALPHPGSGDVELLVRPEQIVLGGPADAVVERVDFRGHDGFLHLRLDVLARTVVARITGPAVPSLGERVGLRVVGAALAVTAVRPRTSVAG